MATSTIGDHQEHGANVNDGPAATPSTRSGSAAACGGLALCLVLSGIALSNTTLALQHAWLEHPSWQDTLASFALSGVGMVLIWRGLSAEDPIASILGYAGGALLWMGFFEWTWMNFALWLGIEPLMVNGSPMLPPSFLLIQASSFIFLPLVFLIAANKDTRCRMMLWIRRRLRLTIPQTPGHRTRHHSSRVSATETIFVIWFIYLLNIALYDPRLLGGSQETYLIGLALIGCWVLFPLSRLFRIPRPGLAVRYAIPTAYLLSVLIDSLTQTGLFPPFWVRPIEYPLLAVTMVAVFAACIYGLCRIKPPQATVPGPSTE